MCICIVCLNMSSISQHGLICMFHLFCMYIPLMLLYNLEFKVVFKYVYMYIYILYIYVHISVCVTFVEMSAVRIIAVTVITLVTKVILL